jgi:hypothetical protein
MILQDSYNDEFAVMNCADRCTVLHSLHQRERYMCIAHRMIAQNTFLQNRINAFSMDISRCSNNKFLLSLLLLLLMLLLEVSTVVLFMYWFQWEAKLQRKFNYGR